MLICCAPLAARADLSPSATKYLQATCPNATELLAASRAADEAAAVNDPDEWQAHRESARQFFRCGETTKNPYSRDLAHLLYAGELSLVASTRPSPTLDDAHQALDMYDRVVKVANDLAASTKYDNLRQKALALRDLIRGTMKGMRAKLDAAAQSGS